MHYNWYNKLKISSFIDDVQLGSCTDSTLVLYINGKRHEYYPIAGKYWFSQIQFWKKWKNKMLAGQKISNLIRNLSDKEINKKDKQLELFKN